MCSNKAMNDQELALEEINNGMIVEELESCPENRLVSACAAGDVNEVRNLLKAGVPVAVATTDTPFTAAAKSSHLEVIELLLEYGLADTENPLITTAGTCDSPTVLKFLAVRGFDPAQADENGWTPLHHAVRRGHLESTKWLQENASVNVNQRDERGRTAIMLASLMPADSHMLRYILTRGDTVISAQDNRGWTALMRCARYGFLENATLLLERGANPNLQTFQKGTSALILAASAEATENDRIMSLDGGLVRVRGDRFPEIVELLLDHGADPTLTDTEGVAPVNHAMWEGNSTIMEILWHAKSDAQARPEIERLVLEQIDLPVGKVILCKFYDKRFFETCVLRASEFTESTEFAGRVFSLSEYRSWFQDRNNCRYGDVVYGINISSESLRVFYEKYEGRLSKEEVALREQLPGGRFYLIGVNFPACGSENYDTTIKHELSHAIFHFDPEYRELATLAWHSITLDVRESILSFFEQHDYASGVHVDEFAAHCIEGFPCNIAISETPILGSLRNRFGIISGVANSGSLEREQK